MNVSEIKSIIKSFCDPRYLSKLNDDTAQGLIAFLRGLQIGKSFVTGSTGGMIGVDSTTGQTFMEIDRLYVRLKAIFEELEIHRNTFVGGKQTISPAGGMTCVKVTDTITGEDGTEQSITNTYTYTDVDGVEHTTTHECWRCYFTAEQDGEKIENKFAVGDQAKCQVFNAKAGVYNKISNKYYWRLVVGVGEDYIDISKTDCDTGSDIPEAGDKIVHEGNRSDKDRQNVVVISSVDTFSPDIVLYEGINSYSYTGKDVVSMGVDKTTGRAFLNVYGNQYVGDRDGSAYMKYDSATKTLTIKGRLDVTSTVGDTPIDQYIKEQAGELDMTEVTNLINAVRDDLQSQIDGAIETWFFSGVPTLTNAPSNEWTTDEVKNVHLGDLYYDKDTGKAYRFQMDGDAYLWQEITDTDIQAALEAASKAQATADGKMKVFASQPTDADEYNIGDIWVNATYPADGSIFNNDIVKAIANKTAGAAFSIAHWQLASKYTDDAKANGALGKLQELEYIKNALTENTTIDGGLILSSLIRLGYTDANGVYQTKSGISGIYDDKQKGGGIAAWYGGSMIDGQIEGNETNADRAKSLFRMDGTGYLAGGNISWNADGSGYVANNALSWDASGNVTLGSGINVSLGDGGQAGLGDTLKSILNYMNSLNSLLVPVDDAGNELTYQQAANAHALKAKVGFFSTSFVSSLGMNDSSGGDVGGGLIETVYGYANLGGVFSDTTRTDTFNAYTINKLAERIAAVEDGAQTSVSWGAITGKPAWIGESKPSYAFSEITGKPTTLAGYGITDGVNSVSLTGTGNVLSGASVSGNVLTLTKGVTALTEHQPIYSLTLQRGGVSVGTYTPNSVATTLNIALPTFAEILSKPTTLAGYGITDGINSLAATGEGNAVTEASISGHTLTLTKGITFLQKSIFDDLFEKVNIGTTAAPVYAIRAKYGFYSDSFVSAMGVNGSTGGGTSFDRLDAWADYTTEKSGYVLSAYLGNDLNTRLTSIEGGAAVSVVSTGTGNVVSAVTKSGTTITVTKGVNALTSHQTVSNKAATLAWGTAVTIATVGSTNITATLPANPNTDTDTKNTAGSTDTSSKIFLIGATTQAANSVTYSHDTAYVGTDGCLYSGGVKVLTAHQSLANYVTLNSAQTISGKKTFSVQQAFSASTVAPFTVASDIVVANLNADKLDGHHVASWNGIPYVGNDGVMEVGKYIDFHLTSTDTSDFAARITAESTGFTLSGTTSGTFSGDLTGNASTATALKTARTIWGNSFNGSANIGGTLTPLSTGTYDVGTSTVKFRYGYFSDKMTVGSLASGSITGSTATLSGLITANGGITIPAAKTLTIGGCVLSWDATNNALKFSTGIYSASFVSAMGLNSATGGGGGVDLLSSWTNYNSTTAASMALGANLGYELKTQIDSLPNNYLRLTGGNLSGALTVGGQAILQGQTTIGGEVLLSGSTGKITSNYSDQSEIMLSVGSEGAVVSHVGTVDVATVHADGLGVVGTVTATTFSGNATSATKLQTSRTINGTSFYGTANITTANWGTARNISIADATAANTGTAVSVNGSAAVTLKLPATIAAALTGNATTATRLQTARTIALSGAVTGSTSFNGSANVSIASTLGSEIVGKDNLATDVTSWIDTKMSGLPFAGTISTATILAQGAAAVDAIFYVTSLKVFVASMIRRLCYSCHFDRPVFTVDVG